MEKQNILHILIALLAIHPPACSAADNAAAPEIPDSVMAPGYWKNWTPEIQARIDKDIETYRKGNACIRFKDINRHKPVGIRQISHAYLFGGNTFLFNDLKSARNNTIYENTFGELFNAATIAFYWKTLEPEAGHPRFTADAAYIYRRPPTDPVVEFCNRKNININGHAIIYGLRLHGHPVWMPENRKEMERIFENHIKQLATRYADRIQRWDVVNECFDQANRGMMPDDYVYKAYTWANRYFPANVQFNTNECDMHWGPTKRYVEIVRNLIDRGVRIDNVGLQMHIFEPEESRDMANGIDKFLRPEQMYATLDCLSQAGRPIHISEVTVCAPDSTARGKAVQAIIARNLYRLCFSYPATMGITWWNVVDGGAAKGEPSYSGLYDSNLNRKPVYEELDRLINHEWKTELNLKPAKDNTVSFRGFKGKYRISWTDKKRKRRESTIDLGGDSCNFSL